MTVPSDWQMVPLGDLLSFSNGVNAGKAAYGRGVPFANVLEVITKESLAVEDIPGRVSLPSEVLDRYRIKRGDILFNRTSETQDEVGLTSVYLDDEPIVFGGFVFRGRPITPRLDVAFSKYALRAAAVRRQIISRGQGGIRANVGQRDLRSVVVPLPSEPEQRAIAAALDDVSEQIRIQQELISKKRALRTAAAQALLSGGRRLAGFSGLWSVRTIGRLATSISGGGTPSRSHEAYWGGDLPWVTAKDFASFDSRRSQEYISRQGLDNSSTRLIPAGTVLMCVRMAVGKVSIYQVDVCINQDIKALFFGPDMSPRFMKHWFALNERLVGASGGGSTVAGISVADLRAVKVRLPNDVEEQRAVAKVLDKFDSDIDQELKRLGKFKLVKAAMQQQLLTGSVRLPVEETSA